MRKSIGNDEIKIINQIKKMEAQDSKIPQFKEQSVKDVYKKMDSSLEGFFYKRPFNVFNFNFLLQILAEKKNLSEALNAFNKMKVNKIIRK